MNIFKRFFNLNYALFWRDESKPVKPNPDPKIVKFIETLTVRDFKYNEDKAWWERTWTTNKGKESALECYQLVDGDKWKAIMLSQDGDIFYEHFIEELT